MANLIAYGSLAVLLMCLASIGVACYLMHEGKSTLSDIVAASGLVISLIAYLTGMIAIAYRVAP